jgi:hypothetical protein
VCVCVRCEWTCCIPILSTPLPPTHTFVRAGDTCLLGVLPLQAYYANALTVAVTESYGQLRVASAKTHLPMPKVYVKVWVLCCCC